MAKKKQDAAKKAALQARKEAKQEKGARKRITKQQKKSAGENSEDIDESASEPIDKVIQSYRSHDSKALGIDKPILENLETVFPLPRANATFEYGTDDKSKGKDHLYLFGGEYFDGIENIVLDELLRFDVQKKEWKQILTPLPRPSPRCAHSCVSYKYYLYVFGGELANSDQYHHYRDLWKFDVRTSTWTEIKAKNPPSARSGMKCLVWKNYMVLFGGFFEALRETKWYNDVHVFNLQTETWMDVPQSRLAIKPEPRSACNMAFYGTDKVIVHGGFSKVKTSNAAVGTKTHTDAWILHLSPILQQKPPTWERWMSSTKSITVNSPNGRAGMSSLSYKNRMLVFGGVVDHEEHHHKVESVFYNDLMAMDIERRKWFPLRINKAGVKKNRRRRKGGEDEENQNEETESKPAVEDGSSSDSDLEEDVVEGENDEAQGDLGWDINMLRSNMFAFVDGDGNIIYEKIDDDEEEKKENNDGEENEETKEEEKEENEEEEKEENENREEDSKKENPNNVTFNSKKITSSSVMVMNETNNVPEAVRREEPLPRINAATLVHGNTMYLLGGILEVGDREVTLDDMWALDLRKRDNWECLWEGTMYKQVWRGAVHDDDDSYISTGVEDGSDDEYDDMSDDDGGERKISKESKRAGLRQEISELNEKYNLGDQNRTPENGECLADFYSRTSEYWNAQASELLSGVDSEPLTNKELKRQGFILANERFEDLGPVLERLAEVSILGEDVKRKSKDAKKKDKKEKKEKKEKKKKSR
uniref:DUF4110 domain-containing protein n=1 Tax=Pseudo-nitzschia australis TaxID=44445 RepID=A0A7S4A982_9STRA|mmetsp:Transcript_2570/g.5594  ORF Transcript_2570/g.5594 Transcript_2570/m.5594 type:complete len:762 (+) Transcript_2570:57-2342(+)